jgi:hypothetical protein
MSNVKVCPPRPGRRLIVEYRGHRLGKEIAEAHYQAAPDDDEPPEAAAMAMPIPRPR